MIRRKRTAKRFKFPPLLRMEMKEPPWTGGMCNDDTVIGQATNSEFGLKF